MINNCFSPAKGSIQKKKRVGRGNSSGLGGECGRGHKGQKSRSGYKSKPGFEGGQMPLYRRIPKKKGFNNSDFNNKYVVINLNQIDKVSKEGENFDLDKLRKLAKSRSNSYIKVLANGTLSKPVFIQAHKISASAIEKLNQIGAKYEILSI